MKEEGTIDRAGTAQHPGGYFIVTIRDSGTPFDPNHTRPAEKRHP